MKPFHVVFTDKALADIDTLYSYISQKLFMPDTADKYVDGILDIIETLMFSANAYANNPHIYIQELYGPNAKSIVYKKITIIYTVKGDRVVIHRIVAGATFV
jgi:plasmid stabilization system protein ParE